MKPVNRRGVCPGLSAPMPTGDGLLVRLIPAGPIALDAFAALCAAARQHGNGTLEVTARGSLQVRGLAAKSAPLFASAVAALGIPASDGVPVITNPLAGEEQCLIDPGLAAELRQALTRERLALAAKVSVALDDGGRLHLDALAADVRLLAIGPAERPRLCIGLGGDAASATWLGTIAPRHTCEVVLGLMSVIAVHGPAARAADVRAEVFRAFESGAVDGIERASAPSPRPSAEPVGLHQLRDGRLAMGLAPAFGHAHADALRELAGIAAALGAGSIRPASPRALLLVGLDPVAAAAVARAADALGFVTQASDPRRRIAACPGAPACASGLIPARALAAILVPARALASRPLAGPDRVVIHVSGCAKGCAHPRPAALTVVGTERGCGIIREGSARGAPSHYVGAPDLGAEVARILATEAHHG
jgi:precorrin-3B synthase